MDGQGLSCRRASSGAASDEVGARPDSSEAPGARDRRAAGKAKPSYKHVPHSQKPAHLVAKRNARERRRVQAVNQAFYRLRKCVPIENRNKRVSKVKTLQRAIDYIRRLERILESEDAEAGGELLVLGDGTVLATSVAPAPAPPRAPARGHRTSAGASANSNTNCDRAPAGNHTTRQRRPRRSKAAAAAAPEAAPAPHEPPASQQAPYLPGDALQAYYAPPGYQQQPSELVLRESSAYNSNLNHHYYHQEPYLPQPAAQYPQPAQTSPPSVGEQPFGGGGGGGGGDYAGGYPGAFYYQQQHQEPQPASGGWRNQQTTLKPEVATFGRAAASGSPPAHESSPAARQQVNTAYLAGRAAHLSFAASDNYQQQLDGAGQHQARAPHGQPSAGADCLPAAGLHDQQQYRHFAGHQQPASSQQQPEYGAAV